jgi:dCTP deaminase
MILSDEDIARLSYKEPPLIMPYLKDKVSEGVSYGPSSFGYDIRLGYNAAVYKHDRNVIDPKGVLEDQVHRLRFGDSPFELPPGGFILSHSVEFFNLPPYITGLVKDKSTYARCGIAVQNTVLEAGWCGQVTLEITNHANRPVKLYPGEGIAQVIFMKGQHACLEPYRGKYQNQVGVTLPRSISQDQSRE